MPSPFPGMDPYLEGPFWSSVHFSLSAEIARQLVPKIAPRYVAIPAERFVLDTLEGVAVTTANIYPDVGVLESGDQPPVIRVGAAVASAPVQVATVMPTPVPHVTIEIRAVDNRELVTAIEVLSLTNKRGEGRKEYLDKRRRVLLSTAHLMEIDLLRSGERVPMQSALPPAPYYVILSRYEKRPICEVWPIQHEQALPTVPVPLLPGDPDVPLDLQLALNTIYGAFRYDLIVDYTQPPKVQLTGEAAKWAQAVLRSKRQA